MVVVDVFRLSEVEKVNLEGLDHVIVCTAVGEAICWRQYMVELKKSGTRLPRVELVECGPSFDFTIRRTKFASSDLMREALRVPKELMHKKVKNKSTNVFGDTLGKIHMERQDLSKLDLARIKGLKRKRKHQNKDDDDVPPAKHTKPNSEDQDQD